VCTARSLSSHPYRMRAGECLSSPCLGGASFWWRSASFSRFCSSSLLVPCATPSIIARDESSCRSASYRCADVRTKDLVSTSQRDYPGEAGDHIGYGSPIGTGPGNVGRFLALFAVGWDLWHATGRESDRDRSSCTPPHFGLITGAKHRGLTPLNVLKSAILLSNGTSHGIRDCQRPGG